jgi:hypothetical protein
VKPWLMRAAVGVLALALGVVVGAGPLQRSSSERDDELAAQKAEVVRKERRIDALESARTFADAFAKGTATSAVGGVLAGRSIALIVLPGADPDVVTNLRELIATAQGQVTSQIDLDAKMARSSSRQLVEALTSQMITKAPEVKVAADASGYQRFGALLARAVGTGPTGQPVRAAYDPTAVGIVSGMQTAELLTQTRPVTARAGLALVVTGAEAASQAAAADNAVPVTILEAFGRALPTVVVGPTGAAGDRGVIGALRGNSAARAAVSTVDSSDTAMGRVAGILALAARAHGTVGQYGAVDAADGAVPES